MSTVCTVEVVAMPSGEVAEMLAEKLGLNDVEEDVRAMPRGTTDFHSERDRWQILSRELQQKQELIHMTLRKTRDQETMIKEKG